MSARAQAPAAAVAVACIASLGCSEESGSAALAPPLAKSCKPGEWQRDDGACVPAGLPPDMPCPPGEWLRETDDACVPAGVPPGACGDGFVHDGDRGCEPILPPEPCPAGLMAVPGDRECHEVASCGTGAWGDIPVEPDTEHVEQTYGGADSDGSAQKPWTTIGDAVAAARDGAIVAIAAGSHVEGVLLVGKAVRLWGRCPAMVEIVGTEPGYGVVNIGHGASGAEVRGVALRGAGTGVLLNGSKDIIVERTWVHHNAERGINVQSTLGPTSITVRSALVEQNAEIGVFVSGSEALVEGTVVRDTLSDSQGMGGRGMAVQARSTGVPSIATLRGSLLEHNREVGLHVSGSEVLVDATVVRETSPDGDGAHGGGVDAQASLTTGAPSSLTLRASLLEKNHEVGVHVSGSEALVEHTVVRRSLPDWQGVAGRGVNVQADPDAGTPSTVTLRASLIEQNHELGVRVSGSKTVVDATVLRGTLPNSEGFLGRGLHAEGDSTTGAQSTVTVRASLIEQSHDAGVLIAGSEALVEATVVRGTFPDSHGFFGRGVQLQPNQVTGEPSSLSMGASLIEGSREAGLGVIDSTATLRASLIRASSSNGKGQLGDGVVAVSLAAPADVTITATRIEQSARAAVSTFGAYVGLGQSALICQTFDLFGGDYDTFAFTLDDLGGNLCGCPDATSPCAAKGEGLDPPPPIGGLE